MANDRNPLTVQELFLQSKYWKGKYFTLSALLYSDEARAHGLDNLPTTEELARLEFFTMQCLDPIREAWGNPVSVNCCFRCPEVNTLAGGVDTSLHCAGKGAAADIRAVGVAENADIRLWLCIADWGLRGQVTPLFDELILYPGRVHVGWRQAGRVGELLEKIGDGKYTAVTVEEIRKRLQG